MNTYPKMNAEIVKLLRMDLDDPVMLYAAARIEELEAIVRDLVAITTTPGNPLVYCPAELVRRASKAMKGK